MSALIKNRAGRSYRNRPYEIFGREISARIAGSGLTLNAIGKRAKVSESAIKAACSGTRPLSPSALENIASLLAVESENMDRVFDLLTQICKSGASRTYLARGLKAPVRVGYLESPPFAYASRGNVKDPQGLLVEVFQTYFQTLRINYEWIPVNYDTLIDALENRTVDLITGFVLESPQRRVRAHFMPLPMPFCLGINAISSSPYIPVELDYSAFCVMMTRGPKSSGSKFNLITIADEIADDFLPLIVGDTETSVRECHRKVTEAIRYYTIEHPDKDTNIVFADQMTCEANLTPGNRLLFKQPIGSLRGGLLLPAYDPEWASFVESSLLALLSAKLPKIGIIFSRFHSHLMPFIFQQNQIQRASPRFGSGKTDEPLDGLWSLETWLSAFWPNEIAYPEQFNDLLANKVDRKSFTCVR